MDSNGKYLKQAKKIIFDKIKNANISVYLFGSRANKTYTKYSDIDIALYSEEPISNLLVSDLKDIFEESTIPYSVDVVNLNKADKQFREKILKTGISWKKD